MAQDHIETRANVLGVGVSAIDMKQALTLADLALQKGSKKGTSASQVFTVLWKLKKIPSSGTS